MLKRVFKFFISGLFITLIISCVKEKNNRKENEEKLNTQSILNKYENAKEKNMD